MTGEPLNVSINLEAEMAALGGLVLEPELIGAHYDDLNPRYFYDPRNQTLALTMLELLSDGQPVDAVTIKNYLQKMGELASANDEGSLKPSASYLSSLQDHVATSAHIGHYLKIAKEKSKLREIYQSVEDNRKRLRQRDFESILTKQAIPLILQ